MLFDPKYRMSKKVIELCSDFEYVGNQLRFFNTQLFRQSEFFSRENCSNWKSLCRVKSWKDCGHSAVPLNTSTWCSLLSSIRVCSQHCCVEVDQAFIYYIRACSTFVRQLILKISVKLDQNEGFTGCRHFWAIEGRSERKAKHFIGQEMAQF